MRHRVADGPKSGLSSQQISRLEVERDQNTGVGSEGPHLCSAVQVLRQDPLVDDSVDLRDRYPGSNCCLTGGQPFH